ncbi:thermonuclease family protein [Nocardia sp. NRRL S-836]|uniref:thermonuclease family protein n=1 Tax=Nocardia sp. NRRL S-836 TaxID=1519492 RepID=UPI0006AFD5DF|nr:excalibur calcium-binding domain-containing protein [Nocardia sp. NRRL S-836]
MGGIVLVALSAGCSAAAQQADVTPVAAPRADPPVTTSAPLPPARLDVKVQAVVSGHAVTLSDGRTVEVGGLAAPGTCWAQAASDFATRMLLGREVRFDPASRALSLADGTDYALLALGNGAARATPAASTAMKEGEAAAVKGTLGFWGPPCNGRDVTETPTPPPPPPPPPPAPAPKPTTTTPKPKPVFFATCEDAWRAGAAPLYWGQPGYRVELDGNRNGIACEQPRR